MLTIDPTSNTPIYQQIVEQIKVGIVKDLLAPGDKLPSVRELATMITINPNTIQKAYQELERQGVIVTMRGRGTFVSEDYRGSTQNPEQLADLKEYFRKGIIDAHYLGMSLPQIKALLEQILEELNLGREGNC